MKDSLGRSRAEESRDGKTRHPNHPPPFPVNPGEVISRLGPGRSLPERDQAELGERFGHDFSRVRLHDDDSGDLQARALGAEAFAVGEHIAFRRGRFDPATLAGQELLGHEAQHLVAEVGTRGRPYSSRVQLEKSIIDDITVEMVGQPFIMRDAGGTAPNEIPKNTKVTVLDWNGTAATATVEGVVKKKSVQADVSKVLLEPDLPGAVGIRKYNVGIDPQQAAVEKLSAQRKKKEDAVAAKQSEKSSFKKNPKYWQSQMKNLQDDLADLETKVGDKETVLSKMLVLQTMYNRFDPVIKHWIDHYSAVFKPATALDPNIVKSMMFREGRFGTSGEHFKLPTDADYDLRKSRFNVMQSIDSSGEQQLIMIQEMAPEVFSKHKLADLKKEHKKKGLSEDGLWAWNGGKLRTAVLEYMAIDPGSKQNRMGTSDKELHQDYEYWIRTGIRWLFYKYSLTKDWPEAVRAFNGLYDKKEKPDAYRFSMNYKKDVMSRTGSMDDLYVDIR